MDAIPAALAPGQLAWRCDAEQLGFESTADIAPLDCMVGQDRAVEAIAFGLSLTARGYNLYVAGPPGTGRTSTVRCQVGPVAAAQPAPPDWCYLHNFQEAYQPIALQLPAGRARELAQDVDELLAACRREIPKGFEGEQYEQRRIALGQALEARRDAILTELHTLAERLGFAVQATPTGFATVPMLGPGQPLTPEGFELLPGEKKVEIRAKGQELQRQIEELLPAFRHLEREAHEQMHALERDTALFAVGHLLDALRAKWADQPGVLQHVDAVQADLLDHLSDFGEHTAPPGELGAISRPAYERYRVNVLVTNDPNGGAPIICESSPTYYNLLGRIDYRAAIGAMQTDYALIKAGALHRANGGYLILQARDLLTSPFAWNALKRALRDAVVRVENLGEQLSGLPTATLKPAPIPLRVKVVIIGDLLTHTLLYRLDEDFQKLFKVKAHFDPAMDRSPDALQAYAAFIGSQAQANGLLPFAKDAVARVVEHGARLAEHRERLATRFNAVAEVLTEADYWARLAGAGQVHGEHVARALAAQERRANLVEEEIQRLIDEGTLAIDTRSEVVGQVNGLSVSDLGDYAFARPSRITATVGLGAEGVVDVEREAELSGPTHSKGVLTLSGYLLGKYAQQQPLAISARLAFEQVYDEVDGDSASSAELYALLSSLADVPIRQGIAVTGSVNQRGEVQAIGAVNRKIEGYFAVCQAQGLTGQQGVLIPWTNVRHLMLKQEVVDAVARGQFHVWAVRTIDEGLALLTGLRAGERQPDGSYPADTVHGRVQRRLATFATRLAEYGGAHRLASARSARRNGVGAPAPARHRRIRR